MKKQIFIILTVFILCLISFGQLNTVKSVESKSHTITITEISDVYQVKEHITIDTQVLTNSSMYHFFLPLNASSDETITIIVEDTQISNPMINNNIYEIALNATNIAETLTTIDITYYLPKSILYLEKTFLQNTSVISIKFKDTYLFKSTGQQIDSTIQIKLIEPIPADSFNLYTIILIILLIIVIIVTSYFAFIKRKNGKERTRSYESNEQLEIEKTLLLNILKDIEKMHRNQKISDDSYHKLKTYYKQQTVDILSNLQELNKK